MVIENMEIKRYVSFLAPQSRIASQMWTFVSYNEKIMWVEKQKQ